MYHPKNQNRAPQSPHERANRFNKMCFWWMRDLYQRGRKRKITEEDIYETNKSQESGRIAEKITQLWNEELTKKDPSILRMFYKAYGVPLLTVGVVFSICESIVRCSQPLFLGGLLSYFADSEGSQSDAYFYGTGIVLTSFLPVIMFHPFIYYSMEIAMKMRIGSSRLIYDKVSCSVYSKHESFLSSRLLRF